MAKYTSGRQKNLKVGLSSYSENLTSLEVVGNQYVTGVITATTFYGTFSGNSSTATYAPNAGVATYAPNAGIATYAPNAGVSTYATSAGIATYAPNAGVSTYAPNAGVSTYAPNAGIATQATRFQNSRTFEITGDIVASPISFDGTGNVSLAATIQPNSVALGTDTTGDYVQSIFGTANQITVTGGTGESSTPTISIPSNPVLPGNVTIANDLQVNNNLNVTGNITIGGTSAYIIANDFRVKDKDIILGFTTNISGQDVSNDTTANHGGIAIASTEGNPLVNLNVVGIETLPPTYKKIMWFKAGAFAGLGTDAWLFNYGVGIGSTQVPNGVRLAVGGVHVTDDTVTATTFSGNATTATAAGTATTTLHIPNLSGDITSTNTVTTLATVNSNVGTYGDVGAIPRVTVNAKGLVTGITTVAPNDGQLSLGVSGTGLSGSATFTANQSGSSTFTVTSNATDANTPSTIVARDASGNFSAGTITANLTGTATTATNLSDAANITTGTINSSRLSGTYNIDISGNAATAGYAITAGIATYATNAGITTYATSAGISTSVIGGIASVTQLSVTGVSTVGVLTATSIGIGTTTPTSSLWVNGDGYFVGVVSASNFYVGGNVIGGGSISGDSIVGTSLSISGISTLGTVKISSGIVTATTGIVTYYGDGRFLEGVIGFAVSLQNPISDPVYPMLANNTGVTTAGISTTQLVFIPSSGNLGIGTTNVTSKLQVQGDVKVSGVVTATTFYGSASGLTDIPTTRGIIDLTNTTASGSYYPTFVSDSSVGIGTTTGLNLTSTKLIFNPSSGSLTAGITRISSSTASPNASTPVATLEAVGASSNYDIAIVPKGNGAIVANIPDGTSVGGNKRGTYAVDLQLSRSSATHVASGENSFIGNGHRNTASGNYSAVLSGSVNTSTSLYSVVCGGNYNTASGENSFIGNGASNTTDGNYTSVINGEGNNAQNATYSIIGGGNGNSLSTDGSHTSILCASYSITRKNYSSIISGYWGDTRNTYGAVVFSGANSSFGTGFFAGGGYQQSRLAILSKETTDDTSSTLTADGNVYDGYNVLDIPTLTAYLVKGSVIAYSNISDIARAWEFTAVIKNTSGATLVGTPIINDIAYDSGASGWDLSITADASTDSLKVEVIGQASTTIRWVTKIDSTEVAFQ